jgi:hypothetical protein
MKEHVQRCFVQFLLLQLSELTKIFGAKITSCWCRQEGRIFTIEGNSRHNGYVCACNFHTQSETFYAYEMVSILEQTQSRPVREKHTSFSKVLCKSLPFECPRSLRKLIYEIIYLAYVQQLRNLSKKADSLIIDTNDPGPKYMLTRLRLGLVAFYQSERPEQKAVLWSKSNYRCKTYNIVVGSRGRRILH